MTGKKTVEVTVTALDDLGYKEAFDIDLYPATTKVQLFRDGEEVTGATMTLTAGESVQLTATSQPGTAAGVYIWRSSSEKLATVDKNGMLTVHGTSGTVTITCTAVDGTGRKAIVKIKVQ